MQHFIDDLEPGIARTLDRKATKLSWGPYTHRRTHEVARKLCLFLTDKCPDAEISDVRRLTGGGSKEQFVFELAGAGASPTRHVLRIDPPQAPVETDRQREFEILRALEGVVPVPRAEWVDPLGEDLGGSALIMSFVNGVTKPSGHRGGNVSGLGVTAGGSLRDSLAAQFVEHLAAFHQMDWQSRSLPSFQVPTADPFQAARWQVNWWARVWRDDMVHPLPTVAVVEQWLYENLPSCDTFSVVHADYRNGNFLFDESSKRITAILDWELAHIGDFHEDLAWIMQSAFGTFENGKFFACGLLPRDEFLDRYAVTTGRTINPRTLHFYDVLAKYKLVVLTFATEIKAVQYRHTHQDALVSWIAAVGHIFHAELAELMRREYGD